MLNDLAIKCHQNSVAHGFWETSNNLGEKIALIHSELSELLEALRHKNPPSEHIPEFSSIEEEIADTLIRIFDFSGYLKLRLDKVVEAKMAFNASRPLKHNKEF